MGRRIVSLGILLITVYSLQAQTTGTASPGAAAKNAPAVIKKQLPASPAPQTAETPSGKMSVKQAVIALDVVDREPRDTGSVFPPGVKRLYCFTEIVDGEGEEIQHRWYWNDDMISAVPLKVSAHRYRTYSAKSIADGMVGEWRVAIVNSKNEEVLKTIKFWVK